MKKILFFLILCASCTKQQPTSSDPRYIMLKGHYYEATLVKMQFRGIDAPYLDTLTVLYNPLQIILPDTVRLSQLNNLNKLQ